MDRVPDVIDIAGFTRITASSMQEVIRLSRLELGDWVLKKEFNENDDPFLHMYLELPPDAQASEVVTRTVLTEHLSLYFKYFDSDYGDLKKLLNMEPLQITILKYGTIAAYEQKMGEHLPRINPGMLDIVGLLRQQADGRTEGGRCCERHSLSLYQHHGLQLLFADVRHVPGHEKDPGDLGVSGGAAGRHPVVRRRHPHAAADVAGHEFLV